MIGAKVSLEAEPRVDWLTSEMVLAGRTVDVRRLDRPRVEAKLAFRLSRPLRGPVATAAEVLAATAAVHPCLDVVPAGGEGGRLLLGDGGPPPAEGQLRRLRIRLCVDGVASEAIVPALAGLDWLGARLVEAFGVAPAGALLVSPGATAAVELRAGTRVAARFGSLGHVDLTATPCASRHEPGEAASLRDRCARPDDLWLYTRMAG